MAYSNVIISKQTETILLGTGVDTTTSQIICQIDVSGSWVGSVAFTRRLAGASASYSTYYVKGADGTTSSAALTAGAIISLDTSASSIFMNHTMTTSGSLIVASSVVIG